jgi:hypothetical protein
MQGFQHEPPDHCASRNVRRRAQRLMRRVKVSRRAVDDDWSDGAALLKATESRVNSWPVQGWSPHALLCRSHARHFSRRSCPTETRREVCVRSIPCGGTGCVGQRGHCWLHATRYADVNTQAPASTNASPLNRPLRALSGASFSTSTKAVMAAIHSRLITPPTNSTSIRAQQQPTQ